MCRFWQKPNTKHVAQKSFQIYSDQLYIFLLLLQTNAFGIVKIKKDTLT